MTAQLGIVRASIQVRAEEYWRAWRVMIWLMDLVWSVMEQDKMT